MSALLLLIEDDAAIRRYLRTTLTAEGYRLAEAESGERGLKQAAGQPPDLVLLDLGLPDIDGQEVLRQLRTWLSAPVIVLSARDEEPQKVQALDNGADDYLTKPFSTAELLARIRVALRHAAHVAGPDDAVQTIGELKLDVAAHRVSVGEQPIHLTPLEFKLLALLMRHAGKVLTHRFLLKEVWGPHDVEETPYLRVFMAGLRRKIEADPAQPRYLLTEPGVGYRLAAE